MCRIKLRMAVGDPIGPAVAGLRLPAVPQAAVAADHEQFKAPVTAGVYLRRPAPSARRRVGRLPRGSAVARLGLEGVP